jgi:Ca2+-binding RTX toxin-like protein
VAAGADVTVVTNTTLAYIDDDATVGATRDVVVQANAREDYLTVAAGGGGGLVGVGGAVSVLVSDATTHAYIGNDATSFANGAQVSAGGNVLVSAVSDTETLTVTGAVSIGAVGVGGSVTVTTIEKDTQAWIGDWAQVKAGGEDGTLEGIYTGVNDTGGFTQNNAFRGVAVQADSSEDTFVVSATASGGVYFGLAGGVSVNVIDSDTTAFIGDNARINQPPETLFNPAAVSVAGDTISLGVGHGLRTGDAVVYGNGGGTSIGGLTHGATYYVIDMGGGNIRLASSLANAQAGTAINFSGAGTGSGHRLTSPANAGQSVSVAAVNDFDAFSFAGGLALGFVGIGGGVDVGVVRNDTTAFIAGGAQVGARGDVDVNALASRDIDTVAIAAAGGAVAAAGSVTVWSIGDAVSSTYQVEQRNEEGNPQAAQSGDAFSAAGAALDPSALSGNAIHFSEGHSFQTGDAVVYDAGEGGTAIGGLVDGQTYYAIRDSGNNIRLAASKANAEIGTALTLDGGVAAGDQHSLRKAASLTDSTSHADGQVGEFTSVMGNYDDRRSVTRLLNPATAVTGNTINFTGAHGFETGDAVAYGSPDGNDIGGLTHGETYYVIKLDDHNIQLADTRDDALAGDELTLNAAAASGRGHQLSFGSGPATSGPDSQQEQGRAMQSAATMIGGSAAGGKAGTALGATGDAAKAGTTAYVGDGAVVRAGDSVDVNAKEVILLDAFAGSAAVGSAAGIGGSVAIVNIGSKVEAYIGDATVIAGSGSTDAVRVQARLVTDVEGRAWGGQAGLLGLGAQVVVIKDNSVQLAHIDAGADISQAGDQVLVKAGADRDVHAQGIGLQFGAATLGASVAVADVGGQTRAWVDGDIGQQPGMSVRDVQILAESTGTVDADTVQGAVGLLFGLSGAVSVADFDPLIEATTGINSDITATRNVTVKAQGIGTATADAIAGTLSLGAAMGASVALATARPTLTARVNGDIRTTGAGTVKLETDADASATAHTTAVAGGLLLGAAGGIAIGEASPTLETELNGTITATGAVQLLGDAVNTAGAEATGVGVGLAGMGVTVARTVIGGGLDVHSDGTVDAGSLLLRAQAVNDALSEADALAGGLLGVGFNHATANIASETKARLGANSVTTTDNDIEVRADAANTGHAIGTGVTVGGIAIGGMVVRVNLGKGSGVDEVVAAVDANADVRQARFLTVTARGDDRLYAEGESAGGGLLTVTGADVSTSSDQSTLLRVGAGAGILAQGVTLMADHDQELDSRGDSVSIGLASGGGTRAGNTATGKAVVDIGANAEITAHNIVVSARNEFDKEHFSLNLAAATAAAGNVDVLLSGTSVGTAADRFRAEVNIGSGARLTTDGDNADPGVLRVEALTDVRALDAVEVDSFSLLGGVTIGKSQVVTHTLAAVNLNGAVLHNKAGDVDLTTKTNTDIRTDVDLTVAAGLSGVITALADVDINAANAVTLNGATVKGADINIYAGRDAYGQVNLIDGFANTDIAAYSLLPNISVPVPTVDIAESNSISVLGASRVQALEDVVLRAIEGLGGDERGTTDGAVLSLSLVPYGVSVPDGAHASSSNTVSIAQAAKIEAGVNNQTLVHVKPITLNGALQKVPGGTDNVVDRIGTPLSAAEKAALGLAADIPYEFAYLNLEAIPFSLSTGTVIQRVAGAGSGGVVGDYYKFLPVGDESTSVVLEDENFSDSGRWQHLGGTAPSDATVYPSNVTGELRTALDGKFYVIKPVELAAPTFNYKNLGNVLLEQRQRVLAWIENHSSNPEAVARYQVQLELIDDALAELGLLETVDGVTLIKRELDILFIELPNVYAAPGSVFIDGNTVINAGTGTPTTLGALMSGGTVVARAGAEIEVLNNSPFTMSVNDAVIRDTKRVTVVNGQYTVLEPGNVYFNNVAVTSNTDSAVKTVTITQDAFAPGAYDTGGFELPALDQDLYVVGDIINEVGDVTIVNNEGSITVSGEIRAENVNITAARDFTLNTDDWFHTNRDPRQYINLNTLRALVFNDAGLPASLSFTNSDGTAGPDPSVSGLTDPAEIAAANARANAMETAINQDRSKILSQGQIAITARYLDINGLIQSGVETITLHIDSSFAPSATGSLLDDDGRAVTGVSFGTDGVPVDAYFDFQRQAIVVDELVPQGGRIILAGQILSTGNGQVRAAYGHASVDIQNTSGYDLIVNRIDTTRDRTGKITIIDTDRLQKNEYTVDAAGVTERVYSGTLQTGTGVNNDDGAYSRIVYALDDTNTYALTDNVQYQPQAGLHYLWTEGQEKVKTEVTKYEKNTFNLFGGNTSFEDWIDSDNSYKWKTVEFTDGTPLLESEVLVMVGDADPQDGTSPAPAGVAGTAYTLSYELRVDTDIDAVQNVTKVFDNRPGGTGKGYKYIGPNTELVLPEQDYTDAAKWQEDASVTQAAAEASVDDQVYLATFQNFSTTAEEWTTGGGWLREKTYHTKITTISGQKDFYTHSLKADYPINIDFVGGSATPFITISSSQDLLIQGDITVADGGEITLTSTLGSVTGTDTTAIFNDSPTVSAIHGDVRLVVEGGEGPLSVTAGGDIRITAVTDDQDSSLTVASVVSSGGDVALIAADGIEAGNPATSLVRGDRVELSAQAGDIGGAGTLRVDSNILGTGGFAARAGGDIDMRETAGDLKLIRARSFATAASVQAGGEVTLRTTAGSILDSTIELDMLADLEGLPLTARQLQLIATLNGDPDPGNDVSEDSFRYPVSPGLYGFLYPHAELLGQTPPLSVTEVFNVTASRVNLVADGGGQVGRSAAPFVIDLGGGFDALSLDAKKILSTATADDVLGVQYGLYRYIGADPTPGDNLVEEDFGDTAKWQAVTPDWVTGTDRSVAQVRAVSAGTLVLVEFSRGEYGLYEYAGPAGSINLSAQNYADTARWHEVTAHRSTDDIGGAPVQPGQLVANRLEAGRVALQLQDDVDVQVTERVRIDADQNVSVQSGSSLIVEHIRAGGDVRINVGGGLADAYEAGGQAAISAFGDLVINAQGPVEGQDGASPFRMQLAGDSRLSVETPGEIDLLQVAADATINGVTETISDLYVARVVSGAGDVSIEVAQGDMIVETVASPAAINLLAQHSILDAADDAASPIVNIEGLDLDLRATTGTIGGASNLLDVLVSGDLSGQAAGSVYLNSPASLNITTLGSTGGGVLLRVDGDTNVGLIRARSGTVDIVTQGALVDRYDEDGADIEACNLDLVAVTGTIGTGGNPFDTDSSYSAPGYLNADALGEVYLIETAGAMNVDEVRSRTADVTLVADASILDFNADPANNVTGVNINLTARHGDIGAAADALEIDSSNPARGWLNASALNSSINVAETDGPLYVGDVLAATGDVRLSVRDTAATDEDLILDANASISAPAGFVLLRVGDDVQAEAGSTIGAGASITVRGDLDDLGVSADAGVGTTMEFHGNLSAPLIEIYGLADRDEVLFTPQALSGHTRILGGAEEDVMVVDRLPNLDVAGKYHADVTGPERLVTGRIEGERDTVDLDGQGATDRYTVLTTGGTDYIVNVHDSGAPNDGADRLTIEGSSGDDVFLLRSGFVARMQPTARDASGAPTAFAGTYERVNYDESVNARLTVEGLEGDDRFYSDDNSAITTLDGGPGADFFQFGQVYGAARESVTSDPGGIARVATGDEVETVQTTLGYLSRGISFATTVYGGDGNDEFIVYSNKALLKLFGEDGNDEFLVRAFIIVGTDQLASTDTEVNGGAGDDLVQYNINAPLSIDGGAGADTLVIIGTEADDSFVVTKDGVQGAGLNVDFTGIEKLEVDGMEGNDHFFVLSTNPKLVTTLIGGLGSDTFDVGGDVTEPIVALSVEGRSGFINHSLASEDPAYHGIFAEGIALNVADGATGTVMVEESGGSTQLVEDGAGGTDVDTYSVRLAVPAPVTATVAYMTVSAALAAFKDRQASGQSVEVSLDGVNYSEALVLTFDSQAAAGSATAWDRTHTVYVRAASDPAEEGERTVVISHSIQSGNPDFDRLYIANVEAQVTDDDKPGLVVKQSGVGTEVVEGLVSDSYTVALTRAPAAGETVTVTLETDAAQVTVPATLVFTSADWNVAQTVNVAAADDAAPENTLLRTIQHHVGSSSPTGTYGHVLETFEVDVDVRDNDAGGLLVTPSDGTTLVSEGHPDTYTLQLTREPTAPVVVSLLSDGQTLVSADSDPLGRFAVSSDGTPTVTFDNTNWNTPFTVRVEVNPDAAVDEGAQPVQVFPAQPHTTSNIAGPLIIEGSQIPGKDRSLKAAVMLPTETDAPLPVLTIEVDENLQTDTLNGFNDGSASADSGTLGLAANASGLETVYEVAAGGIDVAEFGNLSGLNMGGPLTLNFGTPEQPDNRTFDGGVTYHGVEVVDVLLGTNRDSFTVNATLEGAITVVQGGAGDDTIDINGGGGAASPLVVFGDTSQDGFYYDSTTGNITGRGRTYFGDPVELFPVGGDDTIDASDATLGVTIYGGVGNDVIRGGQAGDHLAGGSGDDEIHGGAGADHIYGDAGINVDLTTRLDLAGSVISVVNSDDSGLKDRDPLTAGDDLIHAGTGDDIVFGDFGVITQSAGVQRITSTGSVERIESVNPGLGGVDTVFGNEGVDRVLGGGAGDVLSGNEDGDIVLGDHGVIDYVTGDGDLATPDLVRATDPDQGGSDTLEGNEGDDLLVGGADGDFAYGNLGDDLVLGDSGTVTYTGGIVTRVESTFAGIGGVDTLEGNEGDDLLVGGADGDFAYGNLGNDLVLGDSGTVTYTGGIVTRVESTFAGIGGVDTVFGNEGDDLLVGGADGDFAWGHLGNDLVLGDSGTVTYTGGIVTRVESTFAGIGGVDTLEGNEGDDLLVGGADGDFAYGNAGRDIVLGDSGLVTYGTLITVESTSPDVGGSDTLEGNEGDDLLVGGADGDFVSGNLGDDLALGDNALVTLGGGLTVRTAETTFRAIGGSDTLRGHEGEDVLIGGAAGDRVDGGAGKDLVLGDNAALDRSAATADSYRNPRFRALSGTAIYSTATATAGSVLVTGAQQFDPDGAPVWENFEIQLLDHDFATEAAGGNNFGDDYLAGGAGNDQIFGQLGDDTVQGDGSIDLTVSADRDVAGNLIVAASVEAATDGDDYIEGNGGNDVIFGNLGQDDIVGGSSSLFSLITPDRRPDGSDLVFGGAGGDLARNNLGDESATGHARDADMILGDNGNIYRLVGTNGVAGAGFLSFAYDNYGALKIVPRAAELLDYTAGGADFNAAAATDIGAADELHGESGDDFMYGMKGDDVMFGEGQDDDLVGGYGHDWISGGSGQDGVLGDDGRIYTSRNGTAEPLNGIAATTQGFVSTPGNIQQADLNVTGMLKKSVDLTPFNPDPAGYELFDATQADDILYGGLGSDFLHGGSGDDAMSGAEALEAFYDRPANPGDVLAFNEATGEFAAYDEFNPRTRIEGFLLNFDPAEGPEVGSPTWGTVHSDGDDKLFGDLGNDWLVGGTGRDNLYGGWGDDLLNADDDLDTSAGLNDTFDTHPSYEDRAFGGAGRDVLIGNTGGDRLIDWAGEFNSYIVPFAPFGMATVSRTLQPQLAEFLYALSASDGADFTRAADEGSDPARNGEPYGELGLVRQQDFAWQDQTGGPADPQPGNIPGGPRDVLRSANFTDAANALEGFAVDSGRWTVANSVLQVSATSPNSDAVAVYHIGDPLPGYFEVQASLEVIKPTAGWKANSYLIFDYNSQEDFKFAGIDVSTNKLVMGHRDAGGWHVDKQANIQVKPDTFYNALLAVNGLNATIVINNKTSLTHTFTPRVVDGYSYGLNWGMVGVGSDNSRGAYDNIRVQVLPPAITFQASENFDDGVADLFGGVTGTWGVSGGRYTVAPNGAGAVSLLDLGPDNLSVDALLEMSAKVNTQGRAGFVFDRYSADSFKFVAIDAVSDQVVIGHYTQKSGWVTDAVASRVIDAGVDYTLGVTLKGSTVSVTVNGQAVVGHAFNAVTVDGRFGLLAVSGPAGFDDVAVKTSDRAFLPAAGGAMVAAAAAGELAADAGLTQAQLDQLAAAAMAQWTGALGDGDARLAALGGLRIALADLPGEILGQTEGAGIVIDANGAGHGWFVDGSPLDNSEFRIRLDHQALGAAAASPAAGRMDLLTVVAHEIGHVLGLEHGDEIGYPVMSDSLDAGTRYVVGLEPAAAAHPASGQAAPAPSAMYGWAEILPPAGRAAADPGERRDEEVRDSGVDWDAASGDAWGSVSPFGGKGSKAGAGNLSDFFLKLFKPSGGVGMPRGR